MILKSKSRITGNDTKPLFTTEVMGKHQVTYHQCLDTQFIQTDEPFWLAEAYSDAITALDLGIVSRNIDKAQLTKTVIDRCIPSSKRFLDFGGGYGMFTRLMRDRGYAFTHFDAHCQNIFAGGFELERLQAESFEKFDLATAWEVFEHVPDPRALLEELLSVANAVLFSTELVPRHPVASPDDWWYFAPETGQHISFYTKRSLQNLAEQFGLSLYTDGRSNHLLSMTPLQGNPLARTLLSRSQRALGNVTRKILNRMRKVPRNSLLQGDFEDALSALRESARTCHGSE